MGVTLDIQDSAVVVEMEPLIVGSAQVDELGLWRKS